MKHDNLNGPCECGAWHDINNPRDRGYFTKEQLEKEVKKRMEKIAGDILILHKELELLASFLED
jgi:hypothetical protein